MKPRVLQLLGSFHNGGSERQAISLARLLRDEGSFDVSLAVLNDEGSLRDEAVALAGEIPAFPITSFYRPSFLKQVKAFAAHLREQKIDIVHTTDFYTNVFGMAASASAGTYARIASKRETDGMRTKNQDRVERLAFGAASRIVVNSKAVFDHLVERGVKDTRLELIYNGVDVEKFDSATERADAIRQQYDVPEGMRIVTLVANLRHDVKNVPMFLRVADRVTQRLDDVRFVIAGEGDMKTDLEAMAAQLGIEEYVYFTGRCEDISALLAASYACVLTSIAEGFSNSILEYMASGKPVVATNVGGAAEAIEDHETGYVVTSNDDEEMAQRLLELLDNSTLADKMGQAARQRVTDEFSTEKQLAKTVDLYNRLLA